MRGARPGGLAFLKKDAFPDGKSTPQSRINTFTYVTIPTDRGR